MRSCIKIKRIYEQPESSDGARILVDRLWPRGIKKEEAQLTLWMKEIAPSAELRSWFGHIPDRFEAFKVIYRAELTREAAQPYLDRLIHGYHDERITLLYAAKDKRFNHAVVLKEYVEQLLRHVSDEEHSNG